MDLVRTRTLVGCWLNRESLPAESDPRSALGILKDSVIMKQGSSAARPILRLFTNHPAPPVMLRIYADFNSCDKNGYYWCLRYSGRPLTDVAQELDLHAGQAVVLFYEDADEEFEFDAVLHYADGFWLAMTDDSSYRKIR